MSYFENAKKLKAEMNVVAAVIDDSLAVKAKGLYSSWEKLIGTQAVPGLRFTYEGDLYKVIGAEHTFAQEWVPGIGTESLYARIDETHAGTFDDPIPYDGNMALEQGKYYSQAGVVYKCTRDTGNPVYHALADLVGIYVEVA